MQIVSHASLATCLHRQRLLDEALQVFQQAEQTREKWQPEYQKLYPLQGFLYCALLLDRGVEVAKVVERTEYSLKIVRNLLSILLDKLTLTR